MGVVEVHPLVRGTVALGGNLGALELLDGAMPGIPADLGPSLLDGC